MRLFAALRPPPEILAELEEAVGSLRGRWSHLRWVPRELLHVTVAFYGDLDTDALDRLLPRLEGVASRHERLRLSLAGGGAFPLGGQHARVVWTGLYGERRALARLAASAVAAGRRAGAPVDQHRTYRPHLTLAHSRSPVDVRDLLEPLGTFATHAWTADTLHLVRSHPPDQQFDQQGSSDFEYETVKSWSLARA